MILGRILTKASENTAADLATGGPERALIQAAEQNRLSVQQADPERYLLSLFCPARHQPAIWAILALEVELEKARLAVSEKMMGRIRIQWWREELNRIIAGTSRATHPVLVGLRDVIQTHNFELTDFEPLLDMRETALSADYPFVQFDQMQGWLTGYAVGLHQLIDRVLSGQPTPAEQLRPIAQADSLMRLTRAYKMAPQSHIPFWLPQEWHAKAKDEVIHKSVEYIRNYINNTDINIGALKAINPFSEVSFWAVKCALKRLPGKPENDPLLALKLLLKILIRKVFR